MSTRESEADQLAREPGPVRDVVLARRPELAATDDAAAEQSRAAHDLINEAEQLARYLRVITGGHLTLTVVDNYGKTLRERQGMGWHQAHEAVATAMTGQPQPG